MSMSDINVPVELLRDADRASGPYHEFPEPWCPGGKYDRFDIVPITNNAELYVEGKVMHHCVGSYT